ncbi:MAG: heme ABC exporter ATP-binding protein CcmA [Beijerinckiaceae bacterium]|nr:heme ABC exporter ATP-binding protein CcmA [Beijerinckiaceae bacterium]MCZ8300558.1 heme ABC exporter ATP-binding protein CcmA [Beijerinckiaceae bacterium]
MAPLSTPGRVPAPALAIRGLAMARGYRTLFRDLDIDLAPGQVLQLTGPNGTGKSTLLRLIAGFLRPDAGSIRWSPLPEDATPGECLHYSGHHEGLRDGLTAHDNVATLASLLGGDPGRAEAALIEVGAGPLAELPVEVLSAGQRRRVALARLLAAPRPVWLLDEPFTALDRDGQALVRRLIASHAQAGGLVIAATHQPLDLPDIRHVTLGGPAS